jgi:hypothetical protein
MKDDYRNLFDKDNLEFTISWAQGYCGKLTLEENTFVARTESSVGLNKDFIGGVMQLPVMGEEGVELMNLVIEDIKVISTYKNSFQMLFKLSVVFTKDTYDRSISISSLEGVELLFNTKQLEY